MRPTVEQSPPAGQTCAALPRPRERLHRYSGGRSVADLLVIHDDRGLNAPLSTKLVVVHLDDLDGTAVGQPDRVAGQSRRPRLTRKLSNAMLTCSTHALTKR
jgi:hypothetical protein